MHDLVTYYNLFVQYGKHSLLCNKKFKRRKIKFQFYLVYICETHPIEGWRFDGNYNISQHKNIDERVEALKIMVSEWKKLCSNVVFGQMGIKLIVDNMNDDMRYLFEAWGDRIYICKKNKIIFKGLPGPVLYSLKPLQSKLKSILKSCN